MADIGLVIRISEEDFTLIRSVNNPDFLLLAESRAVLAVKNGTPLPKHYGRLIDADAYIASHAECGWLDDIAVEKFNEITPTVIPATKPPHWIERRLQMGLHDWMCSVCKGHSEDIVRICPNCGVDTEGRYEMEEDDGGYWFEQREQQTTTKEGE